MNGIPRTSNLKPCTFHLEPRTSPHPIPGTFPGYRLENVAEIVFQTQILDHLRIGFSEKFRGGHVDLVYLGQTSDAGAHRKYPVLISCGGEFFLVKQAGTWPHQTHLPLQHIPQLG